MDSHSCPGLESWLSSVLSFMSAGKSQNRYSLNIGSTSDWKTCSESFLNILKIFVNTQKLKVQQMSIYP